MSRGAIHWIVAGRYAGRAEIQCGGGLIARSEPRSALRIAELSGGRLLAPVSQARRDNLPADISSFIGRDAALAEITALLTAHRLVTLSGAPGVGKTRLALRIAGGLRD